MGPDFRGVFDRRDGTFWRFRRTAHGATASPEEAADLGVLVGGPAADLALLDAVEADVDRKSFLAGESTPVFFGSALWNFGVRLLLDAVVDLAPPPGPRPDREGRPRPLEAPFSGQVFKVQANMDPNHRDRMAFLRVCSGRFRRGMVATVARTGRPFATKYAHQMFGRERDTLEEAYPGDVVGLVNASDLRIGDTLYEEEPVAFPPIPTFAPEHFRLARNTDTARYKQFRGGIAQLEEEGVIQVLRDDRLGDQAPVLAAVGPMQFEVLRYRLEAEYGAEVAFEPTPWSVARRTDLHSAEHLGRMRRVEVLRRTDGTLLALFPSDVRLAQVERDHPELTLDPIVAD